MGKLSLAAIALVVGLILSHTSGHSSSASSAEAARAARSGPPTVTVTQSAVGRRIPAGFLGLSTEFTNLEDYAGSNPHAINPIFGQLLRNISPGQAPIFRIGGDSTDWTWWPTTHLHRPQGVRYTLTPRWLAVARALADDVGAKLILGVNLEANSTRLAAAEGQAFVKRIGKSSIESLEVGNEPELYGSLAWYVLGGQKHYGRSSNYSVSDYLRDFRRTAHVLPDLPLGGPNSGGPSWLDSLGRILRSESRIRIASMHRYPLKKCSASTHVTIPELLRPGASQGYAYYVGGFARTAHAQHLPLRLDEMNAVSCGGQYGVSNTFASALWVLDALFELARNGIDGVNVHTRPGMSGELFHFSLSHHKWQAVIRPEYYGLMLFAQAAPAHAKLVKVRGGAASKLQVWATRAKDGRVRVVFINKDLHYGRRVYVRIEGGSGSASLERMLARSASSRSRVTLGGQHLGYRSGALVGRPAAKTLTPVHGRYAISVPAASAAMLTLPAS
jgi:hypothetical protein